MSKSQKADEGRQRKFDLKLVALIAGTVIALAIVWGIVAVTTPNNNETLNTDPTPVATVRTVSGNTADQDKQDATKAVSKILQVADKSPKGIEPLEIIQVLDTGDFTVIDDELPGLVRFSDNATEGFKVSTYQALVTMSAVLEDKKSGDDFVTVSEEAWRSSYADPELGTVFVPLNIFTGGGESFSLEMVFMEGEWKLAPYSLIEAVRISSLLSQPAPSPSPSK